MKKLFTSFSGLVPKVANGTVTPEDLEAGLFAPGCAPEYLFERPHGTLRDPEQVWREELCVSEGQELPPRERDCIPAVRMVQEALARADAEGRAVMRGLSEWRTYTMVAELLRRNEIGEMLPLGNHHKDKHCSNLEIQDWCSAAGLSIEVV